MNVCAVVCVCAHTRMRAYIYESRTRVLVYLCMCESGCMYICVYACLYETLCARIISVLARTYMFVSLVVSMLVCW